MTDPTTTSEQRRIRRFSAITTTRIETLADGVFAIVMTLLVFDIRVPTPERVAEIGFAAALSDVLPNIVTYILSFLILGVLWVGHHNQFFYIRRADRTLLWTNIAFLMAIALVPFSAGLLARYGRAEPLADAIYNLNLIAASTALFFHWWYGTRDNHLLNEYIPLEIRRLVVVRILIPPILYTIAIFVGLFNTDIARAVDVLVPLLYILPNRVDALFRKI
jgi:uncharacterized membrane protein